MAAMDDDFDFGDDLDFDLDMGGSSNKKPKNVVFATGLDTLEAMKDSFDPRDKIDTIIRELMPSAVRSEYSDLENAINDIKSEIDKSTEALTGVVKDVSGVVADFLPDGKIKEKLKDFAKKEGYDGGNQKKTKEEEENERIKQALLEALGESATEEKNKAMVQEAMAQKRDASSQLILKHVYAELKVMNSFNTKYTNKFYAKSLELQYRNLYKLSELVEITKTGWEANRKQVESLLINSSLPDVIKLKTLQAANDPRLRDRAKKSYLGTYFRRFNPFENMKNNIVKNIQNQTAGIKAGLEAALQGKQAIDEIGNAGMGMGPGMMIGGFLGDFIRNNTLGWIGDRLGSTKQGKNAIFNFKEFMTDPRQFLDGLASKESGDTAGSRIRKRLFGMFGKLTGSSSKESTSFINENLDDVKVFDGRAHQAIVKVIPGLLSNIYGAIKAGLKVSDEQAKAGAIYYDNRSGRFRSGEYMAKTFNKRMNRAINRDGYKRYMEYLFREFNGLTGDMGGEYFTEQEKRKIAATMASYYMRNYNSSINVATLTSEDFLKNFSGELKEKMSEGGKQLTARARDDYMVQESVKGALEGIKNSLPNANTYLEDLHKSGHMDIARGMRLVRQDADGNYRVNEEGMNRNIERLAGNIDFGTREQEKTEDTRNWRQRGLDYLNSAEGQQLKEDISSLPMVGKMVVAGSSTASRVQNTHAYQAGKAVYEKGKNTVNSTRNAVVSRVDRLANFLDQDGETITAQLSAKKAKLEQVVSRENLRNLSSKGLASIKTSFNKARDAVSRANKRIEDKIDRIKELGYDGTKEAVKEEALKIYNDGKKQIDKASKLLIEDLNTVGLPPEKIKERIEKYRADVANEVKVMEEKIKSNPNVVAFLNNRQVTAVKGRVTDAANRVIGRGRGFIGRARGLFSQAYSNARVKGNKLGRGLFSMAFGGGAAAAATSDVAAGEPDAATAMEEKLMEGNKRNAEREMKEKMEAEREGSAQNRLKEQEKELQADDKNANKRSGFIGKGMAKKLAIGGVAFLGIKLLQKLGFGMDDMISLGKGIVGSLVTTAKIMIPVVSAIGSVIGKIGSSIGWLASKVGWKDDSDDGTNQFNGDPGKGGGSILGSLTGYGLAAAIGYKMLKPVIGAGKLAWKAGKGMYKAVKWGAGLYKGIVGVGARATAAAGGVAASAAGTAASTAGKAAGKGLLRGALGLAGKFMPWYGAYSMVTGIGDENYTKLDFAMDAAMMAPTGKKLFMKLYNWIANKPGGKPLAAFLEKFQDKVTKVLEKLEKGWGRINKKFKWLKEVLSKPKTIARVGKKVITKVLVKIGALALAATGVGAIITLAAWIGDLVGIFWNWIVKKMSFESSVSDELLGVDLFDPNVQKSLEIDETEVVEELEVEAKKPENKIEEKKAKTTAKSLAAIEAAPPIETKKVEAKKPEQEYTEFEQTIKYTRSNGVIKNYTSNYYQLRRTNEGYVFETDDYIRHYDHDRKNERTGYKKNPMAQPASFTPNSGGVNNPKAPIKPNYNFSKAPAPKNFVYKDIGSVSGWFESRNRPGTVSKGTGDYGGVSYGTWQLASKNGRVADFLKTSKYKKEFEGLQINSPEFKAKWQEIGMRDPDGFQKDQEVYIKRTHYDIAEANLRKIGLDLSKRSDALKASVFSTAVHYGPAGATKSITNALAKAGIDPKTATDEEILNAIYDYKIATVDQKFKSSSPAVRDGVRKRFIQEKSLVMGLLSGLPAPKANPQKENRSTDSANTDTTVAKELVEPTIAPAKETKADIVQASVQQQTRSRGGGVATVKTNTVTGLKSMQDILGKSLQVQEKMLKSLVEIAANTAVFATMGKDNQQQTNSQPAMMPQPVISLERRERFDI